MSRVDLVYRRHDIRRYGETGLGRVKSVCWGRARARAPRRISFGPFATFAVFGFAPASSSHHVLSRVLSNSRYGTRTVCAGQYIAMRLQREGSASVYDFAKTRAKK